MSKLDIEPSGTQDRRLATLDGWRAVSILMVLGAHSEVTAGFPKGLAVPFAWIFDGLLGVRFFFAISGFLITWLLLLEARRTHSVNLRYFYARRALRILPVYFAFLGVLFLLDRTTPFKIDRRTWIGDLTFTTDIIGTQNWTSGHLWSLSVEEQFYLIWPALFILSKAHERIRSAAWVLMFPIVLCPMLRIAGLLELLPGKFSSGIFSFDSIAIGCASALLFFHHPDRIKAMFESKLGPVVAMALLLILTPYTLTRIGRLGIFTLPFGEPSQAIGFCLLLLAGITNPQRLFFPVLQSRGLVKLGVLSYSLYIWQMIFCTKPEAFGLRPVFWLSFPWWVLSALLAAALSFYLLERPLFALRKHFRS